MLVLATILSLLFILCDCGSITCGENQCNGTTINCTDGSACWVTCNINGCESAIINCVDGYDCTISTNGARAAISSTINGNLATKLHVTTATTDSTGDFQLQNAHIYCPIHGECNINCKGGTSEVCGGIDIHAESCNKLTLRCEQDNTACFQVQVWCPKYNSGSPNCILRGEQSSTAAMTQMKIYSAQGFNNVIVENGNTGTSIGTMYCMRNYSLSCPIDGTGNTQCNTSHICDNPPPLTATGSPTTTIPTTSTNSPTSSNPTTYNPTTSTPTTSNPTTSNPTTFNPTTFNPTTNMPTTSAPTTNIPTAIPTTSEPTTNIPTTLQPTIRITSTGTTIDYTISFEIDQIVTEEEIKNIIEQSLTAYSDVNIISTSINEGEVVVEISITDDDNINTNTIKNKIEDGLADEYDKDIDVTVKQNDSLQENKPFFQEILDDKIKLILTILIIALILICCCILIYYWRTRNKKKQYNKDAIEIEMLTNENTTNGTTDTTTLTTKKGETAIDMNEEDDVLPNENIDNDDIGSGSDDNNDMYENNYTKGGNEQVQVNVETKGGDNDDDENMDDENMDEMYEKGTATKK